MSVCECDCECECEYLRLLDLVSYDRCVWHGVVFVLCFVLCGMVMCVHCAFARHDVGVVPGFCVRVRDLLCPPETVSCLMAFLSALAAISCRKIFSKSVAKS